MFETQSARRVARWADLVGELPKQLQAQLDILEVVAAVEEPPIRPDISKLTAQNAEQTVMDLAANIAAGKVLYEARNRVGDIVALDVLRIAGEHAEPTRDALNPAFETCAAAYAEAVANLGGVGLTAPELLAAGPSAVEAFHRAIECERDLKAMEAWVASLVDLPLFKGCAQDPICRITRPTTRSELQQLEDVQGRAGDLSPLYLKALELGVPLALNLPNEAKQIRTEIDAQPVKSDPRQRWVSMR